MATQEQIEVIAQALHDAHPWELFRSIDETQAGVGAVLRILSESGETVTAGEIAGYMNVSTARVAVLLKKMVAKDLIVKEADPADARVTAVRLSPKGRATVEKMRSQIYGEIGTVIDKIGMERMIAYVSISREIKAVLKAPHFDL